MTQFLLAQAVADRTESRAFATAAQAEAETAHDSEMVKRIAGWLTKR
jgi:hypothetical protein